MKLRFASSDDWHASHSRAYRRHRTIEFRQHSGTVEAEKALAWIRFGLGFIEESRRVAAGTNTGALIPSNSKMATVMTMLSRMGGASIDDLIASTGWQRHYADVRIMPM